MKSLTYIEIDIPFCDLSYGVAPCTASGGPKCFNSKKTCQDAENFTPGTVTLRFTKDVLYRPDSIDAIPNIVSLNFNPATISLGENLGTRAVLNVSFADHPHSDAGAGYDKYVDDRDYNPFEQGTYWGKFRARQPYLRGCALRWITGFVGQTLGQMEVRHFLIESSDGPTPDGKFSLVAKDPLKIIDGERAQAPVMNTGYLSGSITNVATSLTLSPSGIGNLEYPGSGYAVIAGKEIVTFTRAGDVMTLTARGQLNTAAASANAQDRVQVMLRYVSQDVADILYDLMVNFGGVPASYISLADWKAETAAFLAQLYSGNICEPTAITTLANELIQQGCLSIWWDDLSEKIRLRVLRAIATDAAAFSPENTIAGTLACKEQSEKRLSQVQTYFGQLNPVKSLTDTDNYRSSSLIVDEDAEDDYGGAVIKKIFSRWIPAGGRAAADRLGVIQLARFRDPPRKFNWDTARNAGTDIVLGGGYKIQSHVFQDITGAPIDIPVQVTRLTPVEDRFKAEGEENLFSVPLQDLNLRNVIIDSSQRNINLRALHDINYPEPISGNVIVCTIRAGIRVTSSNNSLPAFNVGLWPTGVTIELVIEGDIQGAGGGGGRGYYPGGASGSPGDLGGTALYTRQAVSIEFRSGSKLWGGGGGGGGGGANSLDGYAGGGGGGSGDQPGLGGNGAFGLAPSGSPTNGGIGGGGAFGAYSGGKGGDPGQPGVAGPSYNAPGGAAGAAGAQIDGVSFVTVAVNLGDRRGPTIN